MVLRLPGVFRWRPPADTSSLFLFVWVSEHVCMQVPLSLWARIKDGSSGAEYQVVLGDGLKGPMRFNFVTLSRSRAALR